MTEANSAENYSGKGSRHAEEARSRGPSKENQSLKSRKMSGGPERLETTQRFEPLWHWVHIALSRLRVSVCTGRGA